MIAINDKSLLMVDSVQNNSLCIDVKWTFLKIENKIPDQGEIPQNFEIYRFYKSCKIYFLQQLQAWFYYLENKENGEIHLIFTLYGENAWFYQIK